MINSRVSANQIIGSLIYRTREALRNNANFIDAAMASPFGPNYFIDGKFNLLHAPGTISEIKNLMLELDKTQEGRQHKFPAVFNYEQKLRMTANRITTIRINLSFVAITDKDWRTETRERYVFDPILRPVFSEFFNQVRKAEYLKRPLTTDISRWYEIFTTGSYSETSFVPYGDWLDAIEIRDFDLLFYDCAGQLDDIIIQENNLLTQF